MTNIGIHREIAHESDGVHRPVHYWTHSVHHLLQHLEAKNFAYSPKLLGVDEHGREILSYIEGESGAQVWEKIISDEGLSKYAVLLRQYHDAITDYQPPTGSKWAYGHSQPEHGEIVCHGDFGPWNIVWQGDEPVGIIDWDMARPAKPDFDILYALEYAAPFRNDKEALSWHHFTEIPDRKHRIEVFLSAYGTPAISNVASKVAAMEREVNAGARTIAKQGIEPQATWMKDGSLDKFDVYANWIENNKALFEA